MQDEAVFLPDHRGLNIKHAGLIVGGFFIFVQLFFLDTLAVRLGFTVALAVFLLIGFQLSKHNARNWPQKIIINRRGITYGNINAQHGVDSIPWQHVTRMDLYQNDIRLPPFLRIGLAPGAFREQLKRPRLQGMGLDVNIPVLVDVAPEVVLETARRFWKEAG